MGRGECGVFCGVNFFYLSAGFISIFKAGRVLNSLIIPLDLHLMMLTFNKYYFLLAILLFTTEVLIALYVKAGFIRHYFGDFLVVILLYCFVKGFLKISVIKTATGVLLFAYFIEMLQYLGFVKLIGLENNLFANVVLGNYFEWADMLAYSLGIIVVLGAENFKIILRVIINGKPEMNSCNNKIKRSKLN